MGKIEDLDHNFSLEPEPDEADITYYNCLRSPFEIHGLLAPENASDVFHRIPSEIAKSISPGVEKMNACTAGGRVRFRSNSPYVAIDAEIPNANKMPHMAFTGSIGFDLYEWRDGKEVYIKSFIPPLGIQDSYRAAIKLDDTRERDLVINFPLYSSVKQLRIGLSSRSTIQKCRPYSNPFPIVYYGSSITQGACASRPGNSYESMISRMLDTDYINLGFSGNAKGEQNMAKYISTLQMSAFVYDYDHNAPDTAYLERTHGAMFEIIRNAQPELPIVIVSRPAPRRSEAADARFEVIKRTYEGAVAAGDRNVCLIDGRSIMSGIADGSGTVDGCHPNDLGFYSMAQKIGAQLACFLS